MLAHETDVGDQGGDDEKDRFRALRHDLRTPINQIIGYSELLVEEAQDLELPDFVLDLEKITVAARKLTTLVDRLIDETRLAGLKSGPTRSSVPITVFPEAQDPGASIPPDEIPRRGRLLVVDDSEDNREVLARRLRRVGYQVDTAEGGSRALELVETNDYALLLLDVVMPEMDGLEVLRRLRETRDAAQLPVIMCTGRAGSEDVLAALEGGANDYVTKPIDFPVALARVDMQVALKSARDEALRLAEELAVRNDFIRRVFGRYVADDVVDKLLESPEALALGGERRRATVLLTDLRGFSSLSARLGPEQIILILNRYLEIMTRVITRHGGTINELLGDAILVIFGAPVGRSDDARRAVACAIELQLAMEEVNAGNLADGLPELSMGIAVNTGDLVVGNIGSEQRAKYGVVGPPINVCARIESCTSGGQVLVSESALREAGPGIEVGRTLTLQVKSVPEPITAYEVLGLDGLVLPRADEAITPLAAAVRAEVVLLRDKQRAGAPIPARVVGLGDGLASVVIEGALAGPADLELYVELAHGAVGAEPVQARLTFGASAGDGAPVVLRFTNVPDDVHSHFVSCPRAGDAASPT